MITARNTDIGQLIKADSDSDPELFDIADTHRAASQFFTLLKGEPHAQAVFGYSCGARHDTPQAHVAGVVDMFLRAYAKR